MLKPRALRAGDRIAVVAPASGFKRDEFDAGIAELEALGFTPVYDETVFARLTHVAGTAATRAEALRSAWRDPSIAGVIGVRGGYGSMQLLPLLDAAYEDLVAQVDTILIEPDQERVMMTWRVARPLRSNLFEIEQVLVGRKGSEWWQEREAMAFPIPIVVEPWQPKAPAGSAE